MFSRTEPVSSTLSCIAAPILRRRSIGSSWRMSVPSIIISPSSGG
jgi:hypothetical protein